MKEIVPFSHNFFPSMMKFNVQIKMHHFSIIEMREGGEGGALVFIVRDCRSMLAVAAHI